MNGYAVIDKPVCPCFFGNQEGESKESAFVLSHNANESHAVGADTGLIQVASKVQETIW